MPVQTLFNGKFFGAGLTGVHRVAEQLITSVDKFLDKRNSTTETPYAVVLRRYVSTPAFIALPIVREHASVSRLHRVAWEQLYLPYWRRHDFIVNLCNIGPLFHRASATMIHDAQVYSSPSSYSFSFRLWYKIALAIIGRRHRLILTVSEYCQS